MTLKQVAGACSKPPPHNAMCSVVRRYFPFAIEPRNSLLLLVFPIFVIRGASPLGLPYTLSRAPLRRRAPFAWLTRCARSLLPVGHRAEELAVALGLAHLGEQQFHPFDGGQRREDLAEHPHAIEVFLRDEQLLFTGAALLDVDRREHAAIRELAIEMDFQVTRALELFEDDFVHARAGVDERGGDDGQRAPLLDVARRAEEALRALQRVAVHAARQHLARRRDDGVVGASETCNRVEQDHHVLLVLDEALGLFDHHLGDLYVPLRRLVERG